MIDRDNIIRMAREAGMEFRENADEFNTAYCDGVHRDELERFAELVRAAEREKVVRWQIGSGYATGHGETIEDLLVELEWQVRESEREACAKIADEAGPYTAADLIRARGRA